MTVSSRISRVRQEYLNILVNEYLNILVNEIPT